MKYPRPGEEPRCEIEIKPEPWEQQPGEPLEHFRWCQIYLTRPLPRNLTAIAQTVGLPPASRLVARAGSQWNWEKRAAACDKQGDAFSGLQRDWRTQLLNELAYVARFNGLHDSRRALANAAIARMDRAVLRKHLGTLLRRERGLRNLVAPMKEVKESDIDEKDLYWPIVERAREIDMEWVNPIIKAVYRTRAFDPENETGSEYRQRFEAAVAEIENENQQDPASDLPGEIFPWERQPGEPPGCFYLLRIYLSLMFLQSTRQVARMTHAASETTLAKIARKWTWQERAAAFEAHLVDQPLARCDLQLQLLQDIAYELHLDGLLQTNRALERAEIGRLDRATARKFLPLLAGRERSLLQQVSRTGAAAERNSLGQRRDVRLVALIEERALQQATDSWYDQDSTLKLIYGNTETADDEQE